MRKQIESVQAAAPESTQASFSPSPMPDFACDPLPETQLTPLIEDAAKREDLQPNLIRAVVQKESAARPCAVSLKGAQGLMQIMPSTAIQLSVVDPFDPKQNIDAGSKFLKQLLTKYGGDLSLALGAYNAGAGRVDKEGGIPSIPETQNYVAEILEKMKP